MQDNINELKGKMAVNSREHEAKMKQIKEVNQIYTLSLLFTLSHCSTSCDRIVKWYSTIFMS